MKKIYFFTTITFWIVSSCQKDAVTLTKDQISVPNQRLTNENSTVAKSSTNDGAVTYSDVFKISVVGESAINPCTNKLMTAVSGQILINVHGILNGNKSTMSVHVTAQNQKGVDADGRVYISSGTYNEQNTTFSDGALTTKVRHFDRLTTAGSNNNVMTVDVIYIKVDASGTVTVMREPVSEIYCQ